jgi:hypothetical protein
MTTQEFSTEFDLLWDNLRYNNSGYSSLNEYEKSVFLTKAQDELIKNYFNPKGNKYGEGFDDSAKRNSDFSELITTETISGSTSGGTTSIDSRSRYFDVVGDVYFIINESIDIEEDYVAGAIRNSVLPLTFEQYSALSRKVYFEPPKRVSWRLMKNSTNVSSVEIITHTKYTDPDYSIKYKVRYVKKPVPIILEIIGTKDSEGILTTGESIDGEVGVTQCELNPIMHREIISRAIVLANNSLSGNLQSDIELEKRAE